MNKRNKQENGVATQNGKKELSSVRGWLSEATNEWYSDKTSKSHRPLRQSSSVGVITTLGRSKGEPEVKEMALKSVEIPYEKKVKRTKSLWKFRKSEDVLEGMALWKHRSLVDVTSITKEAATPLPAKKSLSLSKSLDDDTEDVSEETIVNGERKEISRRGSVETSSESEIDNESCIVVDDHLKAPKMSSLLPRTRLIRSATKMERKVEGEERPRRNGRAPQEHQQWFDPWDNQ